MVGIVGILLLGSLFWSALGALFGAFGTASQAVPTPRPAPVLVVTVVANTPAPAVAASTPTPQAVGTATPRPTSEPTPAATVAVTATPQSETRAPWILLPQPAPGTKVAPGQITVEARGRGEAPITGMRLELDGAALPVTLEQRSDTTWRGFASVKVSAGSHAVRAVVVDETGKSGSYRWSFEAAP